MKEFKNILSTIFTNSSFKNISLNLLVQTTTLLVGFAASIIIVRNLGSDSLGTYTLILSISEILILFSDLGINNTSIRYAAIFYKNREFDFHKLLIQMTVLIRLILSLFLITILFFRVDYIVYDVWHINKNINIGLIRFTLILVLFSTLISLPMIYFQSIENFKKYSLVLTGQKIIYFIGLLFIILVKMCSVENLLLLMIVSQLFNTISFLFFIPTAFFSNFIKKNFWMEIVQNFKLIKQKIIIYSKEDITHFIFFMILSNAVTMLLLKLDIWMLGSIIDSSSVGLYNVATRFTLPLLILSNSINTVLWPKFSSSFHYNSQIKKIIQFSLIISIFSLTYSLLFPYLSSVIFGSTYSNIVLLAQLLCLRQVIMIFLTPLIILGYNWGFLKYYWKINTIQLCYVFLFNLFFIPKIKMYAPALSLLSNDLLYGIILILLIRKQYDKNKKDGNNGRNIGFAV